MLYTWRHAALGILQRGADMKLYCINARSGQEVWSFYAGQEVTSSPVVQV